MKNVIKRCGVIFICGPIFIIGCLLNMILWATCIVWGPILYIITGIDPMNIEISPLDFASALANWYLEKFGPKDD